MSGAIVRDPALRLGRRYGTALLAESFLLVAAAVCLSAERVIGVYLASAACGLQNALASHFSGAVVRTTHVTGMFTDKGVLLGQRLDGRTVDWRRFRLHALLIAGFILGGAVGTWAFRAMAPRGHLTLLIPAAITGGAAITYGLYRRRTHARHVARRRAKTTSRG